ncbi:hypothetical protein COB21_03365 [Candidatus Aerophobetes bacterium]|uniref:MOMP-like family protein n=1 Tax=Aerophobetes bacterium TaxID=2030807 RepID=A0A2A4X3V3_UNCAE|nr:MAG: hypothetical protein COB21_03365 [Candidatus Aerophobetes bacterium]
MATTSIKKMTFIAFSLLSFTAAVCAGESDNKMKKLQKQMKQTRAENGAGTAGARMAPAKAQIENSYNFNVNFDVLYWSPDIENNSITQSSSFAPGPYGPGTAGGNGLPTAGEMIDLRYDWSWGFRVGVGYDTAHDNWDVGVDYTYFTSSASNNLTAGNNAYYKLVRGSQAIEAAAGDGDFATQVNSTGSLDFQNVNLTLGRAYFVSSNLEFKPTVGLRSAWINDKETVEYGGGAVVGPHGGRGFHGNNTKVIDNCKSWGIGPQIAINTTWHLDHGFSFFGNLSASAIYSSFKTTHKNCYSSDVDFNISVTNNFHAFIPNVDFFLGLRWDSLFNKNKNYFGIGLGWETQVFWNQIQRFESVEGVSATAGAWDGRDLSLQGLTIDVKIDF